MFKTLRTLAVLAAVVSVTMLAAPSTAATGGKVAASDPRPWVASWERPSCVDKETVQTTISVTRPGTGGVRRFVVVSLNAESGEFTRNVVRFTGHTGYFALVSPAPDAVLFSVERIGGKVLQQAGTGGDVPCSRPAVAW